MELAQQRLAVENALGFRDVRPDEVGFHAVAEVGAAEAEPQDDAGEGQEQRPEAYGLPARELADQSRERGIGVPAFGPPLRLMGGQLSWPEAQQQAALPGTHLPALGFRRISS